MGLTRTFTPAVGRARPPRRPALDPRPQERYDHALLTRLRRAAVDQHAVRLRCGASGPEHEQPRLTLFPPLRPWLAR